MASPAPFLQLQSNFDSIWEFSDGYGWFQTSNNWFQLDFDQLWVISGGSGWFWGIADGFGWTALGGCGQVPVVSGGYGLFWVALDGFGWFAVLVATILLTDQAKCLQGDSYL